MIPRKIHIIWIGDEGARPTESIASWIDMNPDYEVRVWGNEELAVLPWHNGDHMRQQAEVRLSGVANMMRYEILYHHGGVYVDADTTCLRPLADWLLEPAEWAVWENEHLRPGLLANTFLGAVPNSPFFGKLIVDISRLETVTDRPSWMTTGPLFVTEEWRKYRHPLAIWPSHFFIPRHYAGEVYEGPIQPFADHHWYTTHNL